MGVNSARPILGNMTVGFFSFPTKCQHFCYNGAQAAAHGPLWLGQSQKMTGSVMMDGARLIFLKEHKKDDVQIQQQQQRAIVIRPMRFKVQRCHAVCTSARQQRRNVAVRRLPGPHAPPPRLHSQRRRCRHQVSVTAGRWLLSG